MKANEPLQNCRHRAFSYHSSQIRPFQGREGDKSHPPRPQYHPRPYKSQSQHLKEEVYKILDNGHTQVKDYELLMQSDIIPYLTSAVRNCHAGQLSGHLNRWKSITLDKSILESKAGKKMESDAPVPSQTVIPHTSFSKEHQEQVDKGSFTKDVR